VSIILVGLNHRTAPVELREQLALSGCALHMALEELTVAAPPIHEHVILSTCNRMEVYAVAGSAADGWATIEKFLSEVQNIPLETLHPHLYFLSDDAAVAHLMRVAAGLDSMVLGEPQILGQVTQALSDAQTVGSVGAVLSHLFTTAIHAGKRARSETAISRYTTSVSHAAALLIADRLNGLRDRRVLVIGAGEMAVLAAKALSAHGAEGLRFVNRTFTRAEALAQQFNGEAHSWYHLHDALAWADVVVTATGAPHTVLYVRDVEQALDHRAGRPLLIVDIAVPRDVEEAVGLLPDVERCDIDALQAAVDSNMAQRQAAVPQVEAILAAEQAGFDHWLRSRQVAPVIAELQRWARSIAEVEATLAVNRLGADERHLEAVINKMAHRLVSKLLHEPTIRLKGYAAEGHGHGYAHAVRELFGLTDLDHIECSHESDACVKTLESGVCTLQCILREA
jgi:glutamyl-tRNA reductase